MKPRLQSTRAARDLIKAHEPFTGEAVRRGKRWVIGYGHTATAREGARLKQEDAELLLIYDVMQALQAVESAVGRDLSEPIRNALVSFAASVGVNAFRVSDVARLARSGRHREAAAALETWVRAEDDGRLVVSERLVRRRAAEKALYLSGLEESSRPAPEPVAEPAAPARTAADESPAPEPRLGPLVELDIAFEIPEDQDAGAPGPAHAGVAVEASGEAPQAGPDAGEAEEAPSPAQAPELQAETPAAEMPEPEEAQEVASGGSGAHEDAGAVKASQDAAIRSVMARMASDMAQSVERAPLQEAEPAAAPGGVQLGYSFLEASVAVFEAETVTEGAPGTTPEDTLDSGPEQDAPRETAPGPVYAAVASVPLQPAPPHPAEAPAPGLSGEADGPAHPDDGDQHGDASGGEDEEPDPAHVAGAEAALLVPPEPLSHEDNRGSWVFGANLAVGLLLTGIGVWDITSNLDAYRALGLSYSWIGPAVFASGVLLTLGSGWIVFGRLFSRKGSA